MPCRETSFRKNRIGKLREAGSTLNHREIRREMAGVETIGADVFAAGHYVLPDTRWNFTSGDPGGSAGTKGTAETQVGVSWPEPLIIASIVVVNVAALCRKWPVNITAVSLFETGRGSHTHTHTHTHSHMLQSPADFTTIVLKIPRRSRELFGDLRVSDFRRTRRIYGPSRLAANPIALHSLSLSLFRFIHSPPDNILPFEASISTWNFTTHANVI